MHLLRRCPLTCALPWNCYGVLQAVMLAFVTSIIAAAQPVPLQPAAPNPAAAKPAKPKPRRMDGFRLDGVQASPIQAVVKGETEAAPTLHWVLPSLPSDDQVLIMESAVRDRVLKELAAWRADPQRTNHPWIVEDGTDWSLVQQLNIAIKEYDIILSDPPPLLKRPRANGAAVPEKAIVSVSDTPRPEIASMAISLSTVASENGGTTDIVEDKVQLSAIAKRMNRPAPDAKEASIPVKIRYHKAEAAELGADIVARALDEVALAAAAVLRKSGYRTGDPEPTTPPSNTSDKIVTPYVLSGGGFGDLAWTTPTADLSRAARDSHDWTLTIIRLQVADTAEIRVGLGGEEGKTPEAHRRLQETADILSARLNDRFALALARVRHRVVTRDALEEVVNEVSQAPEVMRSVPVVRNGSQLLLLPNARWTIQTLAMKVALALSPEEGVTGQGQITGDNLFRLGENESLQLRAGDQVRKISAGLRREWTRGNSNFGTRGLYDWSDDESQRLGGLSRVLEQVVGPKYRVRDLSFTPRASFRIAQPLKPVPGRVSQWRAAFDIDAGYELRDTEVANSEVNDLRIDSASGTTHALVATVRPAFQYNRFSTTGAGISLAQFDFRFTARKALNLGDFSFTQALASAEFATYFGFTRRTDFLLRHRRGFGISNGNTPLFQLFRLGGGDNVRGIEQGEFVGRTLAFAQSEFGVALLPIVHLIRRPKPVDEKKPSTEQPTLPFNLKTTYVKVFYDRGFASDAATASDLIAVRHARKGYGIAIELQGLPVGKRRAALTIGYGRSPDSILHQSGLAVMGLSMEP